MTVDIISFTDAQYATLSEAQLLEVLSAQTRKDNMLKALAEKKRKERYRLLKNGVFRSGVYEALCAQWDAEYEAELEIVKQKLLFYLRFSVKEETPDTDAPYLVDYSLSYEDRYRVVKDYYLNTYTDANERMNKFREDEVATKYLGEFYATLYDYLLNMTKN
jgi:hypothetical protein